MFRFSGMRPCLLVIAALVCAAQGEECDDVQENNVQFLQQSTVIEKVAQQHSIVTDRSTAARSNVTSGTDAAVMRGNSSTPSVVIVGFGDSGTRAVKDTFEFLGVKFSPLQDPDAGDNWASVINDMYTPLLLSAGQGKISREGYSKDPLLWAQAQGSVANSIWLTFGGIATQLGLDMVDSVPWGLKSPGQMYMLPVYDAVLKDSGRYLFVARDPRDFCAVDPGGIHNATQKELAWFGQYKAGTNNGTDCFGFWASGMQDVFDLYENDSRLGILRIEDLVMPDPAVDKSSTHILNSLADFAGVPRPSSEDALRWLTQQHSFSGSYMGQHYNLNDKNRSEIEANFSMHVKEHPGERALLDKLGYHFEKYGLEKPSSQRVFQPAV